MSSLYPCQVRDLEGRPPQRQRLHELVSEARHDMGLVPTEEHCMELQMVSTVLFHVHTLARSCFPEPQGLRASVTNNGATCLIVLLVYRMVALLIQSLRDGSLSKAWVTEGLARWLSIPMCRYVLPSAQTT